jgi:hypothetical protein
LQQGQNSLKVRQDAQEIAIMKLEAKVDKGFELVASEFQKVRHEVELDRVHAEYAKKEAEEAKRSAQLALEKVQDVAIATARADAKADGAKDLAKSSRWANFDPLTGMVLTAIAIIGTLFLMSTRVEKKEQPSGRNLDLLTCGVEVTCTPNTRQPIPANNRGGV